MSYALAMELFTITRAFPREERYALTDQIRRSSRSVVANIVEGYRKKSYPRSYLSKLIDADGELAETQVWIDFALDCGYLTADRHQTLLQRYEEVGRMLSGLMASIETGDS
ncbi:four helix bundle protein [Oscillochloris sp. ZM17-4]|uniref:four helix bundle protein n=1 Tax=Oscillochloris sp. ZM17-4 TaxID=2866714 RepID=UPI001C7385A5|nr:four helix bundle protein [Oscillochloris sp. ZM17-4]